MTTRATDLSPTSKRNRAAEDDSVAATASSVSVSPEDPAARVDEEEMRRKFVRSGSQEYPGDPEVDNVRISTVKSVDIPKLFLEKIPITPEAKSTVLKARAAASSILHGSDDRLIVVVGPCSIHDSDAAIEYAGRLKEVAKQHEKELLIMMRVYFEKPRTTVGWKGFINDPDLDESCHINKGLTAARTLLVNISKIGVPCASEFLDVILPQYMADVISWAAIGARTTESQLHRELASGSSMPVGFKNGTSGDIQVAVDAVKSANHNHTFVGITKFGVPAICHSLGNQDCHIVLRGGRTGTNYDKKSIDETRLALEKAKVLTSIMVDVSHGNSEKKFTNQPKVVKAICDQLEEGCQAIKGVMIESHLNEGNQEIPKPNGSSNVRDKLKYGVSVTDACIGWDDTVQVLSALAQAVKARRATV